MTTRIKELDGIRGIAILMVLVWHYWTCLINIPGTGSPLAWLYLLTTAFWSGVDLFFVLSGFLIGGIILDNYDKSNFLKVFWIRRCARILPLLVLLLFACWGLQRILDPVRYAWLFAQLMPWWSYLSFTQNILMGLHGKFGGGFLGVTWSLAVEEQFYLFAPALILLLGRRVWVRSLPVLIVTAIALRELFPGFHARVNMVFRMDALLLGVLMAVLMRNPKLWAVALRLRLLAGIVFIGLLAGTGLLIACGMPERFKTAWFAVFYALFLLVTLLYERSRITSVLRNPLLCFWGNIAYGLYMYHQCVLGLLHGWLRNGSAPGLENTKAVAVTAGAFVLSVLIAWLSFHTVESFFLNRVRRQKYE